MTTHAEAHTTASPFHRGELEIQERLGVRDRMDRFGRRVIRDFMPDQHRQLYEKLPFIVGGHVDDEGAPWASLLVGRPGFIQTPDARTLVVGARPLPGDPLNGHLRAGLSVGVLGLELSSRRRNRLTTRVWGVNGGAITLGVEQAFGNCPQYIQTRALTFVREPGAPHDAPPPVTMAVLDERARRLVETADTFFVASAASRDGKEALLGADASHRGGQPGFVRVDDDGTLTVPDFVGNFHFNTLGNFQMYPRAGLTFVDFDTGEVLLMSGRTEIVWEGDEVTAFRGAERLWRFHPERIVRLRDALPMRFAFGEFSPNTHLTGTWHQVTASLEAERLRETFRPFRVLRVVDESTTIRSFFLEPLDGHGLASFEPGQHLVVRVEPPTGRPWIRTYTLSSAPADPFYRISVKRDGAASTFLHEHVKAGDIIDAKAPRGAFSFDARGPRPAVLLSAGVGITPMMSMLRHAALELVRTRQSRPICFLHSARTAAERAFHGEVERLAAANDQVQTLSFLTAPGPGDDAEGIGRITAATLQASLPLDDEEFFLCGPGGFMQAMYDALRGLGVPDARIFAETFGPSSLQRSTDEGAMPAPEATRPAATEAVVAFTESGFEMPWTPEAGSLLELAEAHGIDAPYACRSGACGTCAANVEGDVTYRVAPAVTPRPGCALLCQAVPAARGGDGLVHLKVAL